MGLQFTVLTFNAGLLRIKAQGFNFFEYTPYLEERLKHLPPSLRRLGADVVALQEVYDLEHAEYLVQELKDIYPNVYYCREIPYYGLMHGLMLFSRHPMKTKNFVRFRNCTLDEWIFASKGFLRGRISLTPEIELDVVNLHTTAGGAFFHPESTRVNWIREMQVAEVLSPLPESRPPGLIVGDLNAGPEVSRQAYDRLIQAGFHDAFAEFEGCTWDPLNPLNKKCYHAGCPSQRIDHIFYRHGSQSKFNLVDRRLVLHEPVVEVQSGERICLSDHYGVMSVFELHHAAASVASRQVQARVTKDGTVAVLRKGQ